MPFMGYKTEVYLSRKPHQEEYYPVEQEVNGLVSKRTRNEERRSTNRLVTGNKVLLQRGGLEEGRTGEERVEAGRTVALYSVVPTMLKTIKVKTSNKILIL